ncbi:tRNA (N(6)-L-threonylcarbamoyladenosine(37)-C(2))-methylthiotransferase MtaB [Baileyella intestinalis]|uniref:tRNA (N(6)-L-threonylcarbamoyladenosine(37)-C(2))- methylthiotransferase MtaB n=1 Tax=Baileyella intestinalis TaxID=2606709 RepID=UPI0022E8C1A1|nr:tRNA (N(6)-L-threonylcarbamoyladenosine(37)-C(2))-methylthiotransferase MtaB [Baileyella intestinalis]
MKAAFHTLGCKVNQYETEAIKENFAARGTEIVGEEDWADVYVINTCTVTNIADRKSRQYIRRMKKLNPDSLMVVTGCYAQVGAEELEKMSDVDMIVGNNLKSSICQMVFDELDRRLTGVNPEENKESAAGIVSNNGFVHNENSKIEEILDYSNLDTYEDMGLVTSGESEMSRAYIKIQEGCNKFCSYCLIPYARGQIRSRSVDAIVEEASQLISRGYRELILTGINTALYGMEDDFVFEARDDEAGLRGIEVAIKRVNELPGDFRIRLSSLEPNVVDVEHVERLLKYNKLCHHLHLALQSGSDHVLDLMHRDYTREEFLDIVRALRAKDPLFGITTDIIAGFPGETEENFEDTLDMVRRAEFGKVHPFRYSPRQGTKAFSMGDTITGEVKNRRARELGKAGEESARRFHEKNLGTVARVLVESIEDGIAQGYSANYIKVRFKADEQTKQGEFRSVRLVEIYNEGCLGEATEEGR